MLNKQLKAQLQGTLPSGITFRGDNALWVKKSKSFIHNGEKKERTLTHTIKLGITPEMDTAEARKQFERRLQEALKVKDEMANRLASRLFLEGDMPIKNADTSLTGLFASMLPVVYRKVGDKHLSCIKSYFQETMNFFAERDKIHQLKTYIMIGHWGVQRLCRKQIENRPMNMYGTANTNSVNKRLGVETDNCLCN